MTHVIRIGRMLVIAITLIAVSSTAMADDPVITQEVTVKVKKAGDESTISAVGFGHFEKAHVLKLKMTAPGDMSIKESHCDDEAGTIMWQPDPEGSNETTAKSHTWKALGILPDFNMTDEEKSHAANFWGILVGGGGQGGQGGTPPEFEARVPDVDIDGDTDNNSTDAHRPPAETQDEDTKEYAQGAGTEDDRVGLIIGINDDNDVNWTARDYELHGASGADYGKDDEILELKLKINARKAGTLDVSTVSGPLWCYDEADHEVDMDSAQFDDSVPKSNDVFTKPLRIETHWYVVSGATGTIFAYFQPADGHDGDWPCDYLNWAAVGTDIDVDSDNSGTIEDTNTRDGSGEQHEDFYENHGTNVPTGKEQYKNGMLVPVNDDDDNANGEPDNGWNGTDWSGTDGSTVVVGENDTKPLKLRKLNLPDRVWQAMETMGANKPTLRLRQESGDGSVRIFTTEATPRVVLDYSKEHSQTSLPGGATLWDTLKGQTATDVALQIEGLVPGAIEMEIVITLNGTTGPVIHRDRVRITVIQASLTLYKRDGTTKVTKKVDPGAYVALNNDDDDADGGGTAMDKDDVNGVTGEDDLVKAEFKFDATFDNLQEGTITIERTNGKVKLWKQATKGTDQELTFTNNKREYDLSNATQRQAFADEVKNKVCYVEGVEASAAIRDSGLKLTFVKSTNTIASDETKITAIDLALQMYKRDGTTLIGLDKKADPGSFILYNNDDDDADGTMDRADDAITGEDDSAKARLAFGALFDDLQKGRVTLQRASDKIKVWKAAAKGADSELAFTTNKRTYDLTTAPGRTAFQNEIRNKDVFVEGYTVSGAVRDTGLTLTYDDGDTTPADVAVNTVAITVVMIDLKEISFSGDKYHEIKKDDSSIDFDAPHWKDSSSPRDKDADDAGDRKYPISFTRDTFMKISAKVEISPAAAFPAAPKLKADHSGNYDFAADGAKSGTEVTITTVQCANKLANTVAYVNPLELAWSMSIDGGTEWFTFGKTQNVLYVTLGDPVAGTTLWETPLKIGCHRANGENADILDEIWGEFTDLDVRRVDGVRLIYWKTGGPNQSISTLLASADGDGSCIAFAQLLHWCMKSQGLASQVYMVTPDAVANPNVQGMLVKNWKFDRHIHTGADGKRNSAKVGDDDQTCNVGNGFPNTTAIEAGTNLVTAAGAGDAVVGNTVTTGADGVCNTTPAGNDIPRIPVGQGKPNEVCITAGTDGTLQTANGGDDQIVGNTITTGANGICQSTKAGDDQDPIPLNTGLPNAVCVDAGINLATTPAVDDAVAGNTISTGANGLRDTDPAGNDVAAIPVKGNGKANLPCLLPGPDGVLNSTKAGDDDYADGVLAGQPYPYLVDADARDQAGAPAQGNADPPRIFQNHWLCKIGGKVYDPSYGIGDKTEAEYEDASMDGYSGPGGTCKKNAAADELDFTRDAARE